MHQNRVVTIQNRRRSITLIEKPVYKAFGDEINKMGCSIKFGTVDIKAHRTRDGKLRQSTRLSQNGHGKKQNGYTPTRRGSGPRLQGRDKTVQISSRGVSLNSPACPLVVATRTVSAVSDAMREDANTRSIMLKKTFGRQNWRLSWQCIYRLSSSYRTRWIFMLEGLHITFTNSEVWPLEINTVYQIQTSAFRNPTNPTLFVLLISQRLAIPIFKCVTWGTIQIIRDKVVKASRWVFWSKVIYS
jgi:hypothetical protein